MAFFRKKDPFGTGTSVKKPRSRMRVILTGLLVTMIFGAIYFYLALPPINLHDPQFYVFIGLLCAVFCICSLVTSGMSMEEGTPQEYFSFLKRQCKIPLFIVIALVGIYAVGNIASLPLLRASSYRDLLTVEEGDFAQDVNEISFDEIPMLDEVSARRLGDRKLGELADMVSQFEVSESYTQINYQGRPVRVAPLIYGDFFKWLNNRSEGLPAYIRIDMVTQQAEVIRLSDMGLDGIRYSPSELFGRRLDRHLRFTYPTFMFGESTFEINEEGHPYWVCPKIEKTIGLFGGTDINGAVLVDAITGQSTYYSREEAPSWIDRVYLADLIVEQYDYHGTYVHGFFNSIFGQKDVTVTTSGYNYIAMNDDVFLYTGITSAGGDQSNVGFLLSNQRTKETTYYAAPGAIEESARDSAEGVVQDLGYTTTFPLLLNVSGEPTYFMSLKDASQLVKMYAMVNVQQYQLVATGTTVSECEANYIRLLNEKGVTTPEQLPQTEQTGVIEDIRSNVISGTSYYYLRLSGNDFYYAISAENCPEAVVFNAGDTVAVQYAAGQDGEIRTALSVVKR